MLPYGSFDLRRTPCSGWTGQTVHFHRTAHFVTARRTLVGVQDYYNRKGLISNDGQKKKAFFVLQEYYQGLAATAR